MADKCTMFDQYPCDRLTSLQRELDEALRQKALAREAMDKLGVSLGELQEQFNGLCRERDELRALVDDIRNLMGQL